MSDSIARLSVLITGDASPLGQATRQGAGYVKQFERESGGSLMAVGQAARSTSAAFSVAGGNLGKLTSLAAGLNPVHVGLLLVAAAAVKITSSLAQAADEADVSATKIADAYEAAYEKLHGKKIDVGFNKEDSWTGQHERMMQEFGRLQSVLGGPLADGMERISRSFAEVFKMMADDLMSDEQKAQEKKLALLQKQTEELKKQAEAKEKAAKAAQEAAEKEARELARVRKEMQDRADAIARSVRTPREELVASLAELSQLFGAGMLTAEAYERAAQKAGREFAEASKLKDRMEPRESSVSPLVGAATRWTTEGFTALQEARQAGARQAEIARQQLEAEREAARLLEEIRDELTGAGLSEREAGIVVEEVTW